MPGRHNTPFPILKVKLVFRCGIFRIFLPTGNCLVLQLILGFWNYFLFWSYLAHAAGNSQAEKDGNCPHGLTVSYFCSNWVNLH